ncbi:MAG: hypothetical protein WBL50_10100 [Candidatus Acidiferrum sp.]
MSSETGDTSDDRRAELVSNFDNAPPQGDCHSMGAIVCAEFRQNAPHMGFDGLFRDGEMVGNHFVGIAGGHLSQNLDLTLRQ